MIPAAFDYVAPATLDDALSALASADAEAKILAGGHSLIPLMKLRLAAPELLIDLGHIDGLAYIEEHGEYVAIGPMTTHFTVATSPLLLNRAPLLARAASVVGDMQVRNRGTIAGSLAHADPAADLPAVALALGASVIARSSRCEREIVADEFFQDIWTSALEPDEIITEVRIPIRTDTSAQWYEKFRQRASDWAIVGVAVNLTRKDGQIADAKVTLVNVAPTPVRASGVEEVLRGAAIDDGLINRAAQRAGEGLEPSAELRASPEYKRHLAGVLTRRALRSALDGEAR